jgi:hypothetical protein
MWGLEFLKLLDYYRDRVSRWLERLEKTKVAEAEPVAAVRGIGAAKIAAITGGMVGAETTSGVEREAEEAERAAFNAESAAKAVISSAIYSAAFTAALFTVFEVFHLLS